LRQSSTVTEIVVDAKETSVQPTINYFTYYATIADNREDNPIVYGTIQTYLKDSMERFVICIFDLRILPWKFNTLSI
ncbi:hypothetical protein U1Q18_032497, partial [Sarracenia purpurea var. burkii]